MTPEERLLTLSDTHVAHATKNLNKLKEKPKRTPTKKTPPH
jgi:hypothetical protein